MSIELKPCPACGSSAIFVDDRDCVQCEALVCQTEGPYDDPTGAKWNALPRRTPGTIEVPVSEVEQVERDRVAFNMILARDGTDRRVEWLSLSKIIACLPPREPDHVETLRGMLKAERSELIRAALEAAIRALGGKP